MSIIKGALNPVVTGSATFSGNTSITRLTANTAYTSSVSASIASTAVDIFVYDTRKDSDGGAWRKRCQHTSWYNETLNTATRGSRQEFPSIAVIVVTATNLTIYDGDDPDLPMWMVFNTPTSGWNTSLFPLVGAPNSLTAVSAVNGIIAVSTTGNTIGLVCLRFVSDNTYCYCTSGYGGIDSSPLVNRHIGGHTFGAGTGSNLPSIINNYLNDVAMMVPANASIDASTGLPIPTIAVPTNGGVSIISNNTLTATVSETSGPNSAQKVHWRSDGKLMLYTSGTSGIADWSQLYCFYPPAAGTSVTAGYYYQMNGSLSGYEMHGGSWDNASLGAKCMSNSAADLSALTENAAGTDQGLTLLSPNNPAVAKDMSAYITSKYNTGWLPNDARGAWLADITAGTITGTELVTNGTFNSNVSGWTTYPGATAVLSSNRMVVTSSTSSPWNGVYQAITCVVGQQYVVTADVITSNNWGSINVTDSAFSANKSACVQYSSWNGGSTFPLKASVMFTATSTTMYINIDNLNTSYATATTIDNISCKIADSDRSSNNRGLQVIGTLTKTAVATGSDVVGYSGFSSSNYLYQPYNSILPAGTGSVTFVTWFKMNSTATSNSYFIHRGTADATESLRVAYSAPNYIYFDYGGSSAYATSALPSTGVWHHLVCTVTAGQIGRIYLDGVLQTNINSGAAPSTFLDDAAYTMTIGGSVVYGGWLDGSMALTRYSLSAMTADQVAKMYNDERMLFEPGAKTTLYGTSDSITALAYDDRTNLLHVGTSSGRSVFNGLRRVDNTTTPVTTAISASNGMVVEQ